MTLVTQRIGRSSPNLKLPASLELGTQSFRLSVSDSHDILLSVQNRCRCPCKPDSLQESVSVNATACLVSKAGDLGTTPGLWVTKRCSFYVIKVTRVTYASLGVWP